MKPVILFALVAWLGLADAVAQEPGLATPSAQDKRPAEVDHSDGRKARLLTAMVAWVQQYGDATPQPIPALDSTSVMGFQRSLSGHVDLAELTDRVQKKLSGKSFEAAPVTQVADAIKLVVTDKYNPRPKAKPHLPALAAALGRILNAKAAQPPANTSVDTMQRTAPAAPQAVEPIPVEESVTSKPVSTPWGAAVIGFIMGMLAGVAGYYYWLASRKHQLERAREAQTAIDKEQRAERTRQRTERINQQERRIMELEEQVDNLRTENRRLSGRPTPAVSAPPPPAAPVREPLAVVAPLAATPEPDRTVELSVAHAPAAPTRFYAPAPDVPYIEHRKLSREPFDVMPIRLLVPDGPTGTTATYGFSPEADQTRILADGVRNLRAFFDFELPPKEQFTRIETAEPGRLERVGERWEMRAKARLVIS